MRLMFSWHSGSGGLGKGNGSLQMADSYEYYYRPKIAHSRELLSYMMSTSQKYYDDPDSDDDEAEGVVDPGVLDPCLGCDHPEPVPPPQPQELYMNLIPRLSLHSFVDPNLCQAIHETTMRMYSLSSPLRKANDPSYILNTPLPHRNSSPQRINASAIPLPREVVGLFRGFYVISRGTEVNAWLGGTDYARFVGPACFYVGHENTIRATRTRGEEDEGERGYLVRVTGAEVLSELRKKGLMCRNNNILMCNDSRLVLFRYTGLSDEQVAWYRRTSTT